MMLATLAVSTFLLQAPALPLTASPTAGEQQIDLPLSGLAPGEYVVEIKAGDQDGDAKELVAFRVTG